MFIVKRQPENLTLTQWDAITGDEYVEICGLQERLEKAHYDYVNRITNARSWNEHIAKYGME